MNDSTRTQLKIIVERAVRPMRASVSHKVKVREELLAHVTAVFVEEAARLGDEQAALERTAQRFGNPAELTGQLQQSVPTFDSIERFADWVSFRPCESTLRRAVRYTIIIEVVALLFLFAVLLLLRREVGGLPADALWHTCPVLFISGYLGFTICIFESSIRQLLGEHTMRSWLQLAIALVGSTIVSMFLVWILGASLQKGIKVAFFTVWLPVGLSWRLARSFASRKRYHEDWANLQIE